MFGGFFCEELIKWIQQHSGREVVVVYLLLGSSLTMDVGDPFSLVFGGAVANLFELVGRHEGS